MGMASSTFPAGSFKGIARRRDGALRGPFLFVAVSLDGIGPIPHDERVLFRLVSPVTILSLASFDTAGNGWLYRFERSIFRQLKSGSMRVLLGSLILFVKSNTFVKTPLGQNRF